MAKKVRVGPLVVLVIMLGAVLALVLTNPGDKDFSGYLAAKGAASAQRNVGGVVGTVLKNIGEGGGKISALNYSRKNLYVASLFVPKSALTEKTYLGVFKKVFIGF